MIGSKGPFRVDSQPFNPSNTKPPFFQIFDNSFLAVLGSNPSVRAIARNDTFAFAHEAPVFIPQTNEVFFASNDGGALGNSDINHNNQVSRISLTEAAKGGNVTFTKVRYSPAIVLLLSQYVTHFSEGAVGRYRSNDEWRHKLPLTTPPHQLRKRSSPS